jgi:hypothetical protein
MTRDVVLREKVLPRLDDPVSDVLIGTAAVIARGLEHVGHLAVRVSGPGARLLLDPPFVPRSRRPMRLVDALAQRGRLERISLIQTLDQVMAAVVPVVVTHLVELTPLTELIRQNVDLDELVADVDVEAVVTGIDLDAVVRLVDLDAILDRVDLNQVVMEKLDLDAVVRTVDLDEILDRIDLVALANDVVAAIDLPGIIRESSGSLASETVRSVRMQSIDADRAIERFIERFRDRRRLRPGDQLPGGAAT